jgi:hypothetical protein
MERSFNQILADNGIETIYPDKKGGSIFLTNGEVAIFRPTIEGLWYAVKHAFGLDVEELSRVDYCRKD